MIDDRVRSAERKGAFKNLRGQGRRLNLDEGTGDQWLANHLLREQGVLPEWLELRKEIFAMRPVVQQALREYREQEEVLDRTRPGDAAILRRLEERYRERAAEINLRIDQHNLRCPSIQHERPRFQEDALTRERSRRH